jgi:ParB-like nuclease domain
MSNCTHKRIRSVVIGEEGNGAVSRSRLNLDLLRLDFQPSANLLEDVVQEKMNQIAAGEGFEPIIVRYDGESYFVQDGFHRVEAAHRCNVQDIDAEISPGTLQEIEREFREMLTMLKADLASDPKL